MPDFKNEEMDLARRLIEVKIDEQLRWHNIRDNAEREQIIKGIFNKTLGDKDLIFEYLAKKEII